MPPIKHHKNLIINEELQAILDRHRPLFTNESELIRAMIRHYDHCMKVELTKNK